MKKKVTMEQIAKVAGVTRATVDKVLNQREGVSVEVRAKIIQIAKEMGYTPNYVAKALASQKKIVIGIINAKSDNPFYMDVKKGIEKASAELKDYGIVVCYREMERVEVGEQLRLIDELSQQSLSALVVVPLDDQQIREKLNNIAANNVKIITICSDILLVDKLCFIGQNNYNAGRIAGDLFVKLLDNKGKIAIITGLLNMRSQNQRIKGFKDVIEKRSPDIDIVKIIENFEDDEVSFERTLDLLNSESDLRGIFVVAGGIGGVGKAIQHVGKQGSIKVVCYDALQITVDLIKQGVIDFTVTQAPFYQGYTSIKVLFDVLFKGEEIESKFIESRSNIMTIENCYQ